jgi:hypothetical protein
MAHIRARSMLGGPTAHDGTFSPVVRSQYQRQVRPCRRSRCSTTPASIHLDNAKHIATERLANSFDYADEHELRRRAGRFTSPTGSAIQAHTSTRPDQIPIAVTRGPRFRAIGFLQRHSMARARSRSRCRASQKPQSCATCPDATSALTVTRLRSRGAKSGRNQTCRNRTSVVYCTSPGAVTPKDWLTS